MIIQLLLWLSPPYWPNTNIVSEPVFGDQVKYANQTKKLKFTAKVRISKYNPENILHRNIKKIS
jgi:hypothetical protein